MSKKISFCLKIYFKHHTWNQVSGNQVICGISVNENWIRLYVGFFGKDIADEQGPSFKTD